MNGVLQQRSLFTSPWRGEVGARSAPGGCDTAFPSPHPGVLRTPTLPLQGRVKDVP